MTPQWPKPDAASLLERLRYPEVGPCRAVLDCDPGNEVDDQFAILHALLSPDRIDLQAIYAAPFHNHNSASVQDGLEKSFLEAGRVLRVAGRDGFGPLLHGSDRMLRADYAPVESDAARDLVRRAMEPAASPLFVVATAVATDIASAILMEPRIIDRIVVVWLGGHALDWPDTREFNLQQDPLSARVLLDCGVPLVLVSCLGVSSHLLLSVAGLEADLGDTEVGGYLAQIMRQDHADHFAYEKEIWDLAATAYLVNPVFVPTEVRPSPVLTPDLHWSHDETRHPIRVARWVQRNAVIHDLYTKIRSG